MTKYVVRLGDVAEIACDDAEQARDLASLPLMPAPPAGSHRFLRRREIEDSLAAHEVDLQELTIAGAAQVTIFGPRGAMPREDASRSAADAGSNSAAICDDDLSTLISSYLKTKSADAGGWTVSCELPPRHTAALATAMSRPVCQGGEVPWTGRQRFEISFATATGTTKFSVYAEVKPAAIPVVIATRAMARGEVVTAADVELQDLDYVPKPSDRRVVARSIDMLVGMEVRQPIQAGSMLFMDAVQPPLLVKRGEVIRISSQSGGIRVRTTARALQNCSQGQLVEVESLATKERFDARVVGPGEAVIVAIEMPTISERSKPNGTVRR